MAGIVTSAAITSSQSWWLMWFWEKVAPTAEAAAWTWTRKTCVKWWRPCEDQVHQGWSKGKYLNPLNVQQYLTITVHKWQNALQNDYNMQSFQHTKVHGLCDMKHHACRTTYGPLSPHTCAPAMPVIYSCDEFLGLPKWKKTKECTGNGRKKDQEVKKKRNETWYQWYLYNNTKKWIHITNHIYSL